MEEHSNKKTLYIVGAVILVIMLIGGGFMFMNSSSKAPEPAQPKKQVVEEKVVPTVDASVTVTLEYMKNGQDVLLAVKGIPEGTTALEYELSYDTKKQGLQGISTEPAEIEPGQKEWEKELKFATCSSGTCIDQEVVGPVKVSLKFIGSYGEKVFEKEYDLES